MEITTKFNIGDTLFTIDKESMKIIEFQVTSAHVFIYKSPEDTSIYYNTTYQEDRCFRTKQELMEFIDKPED